MDLAAQTAQLEARRKEALARQDPVLYSLLTDTLGIKEIEDSFLYEQGHIQPQELNVAFSQNSRLGVDFNGRNPTGHSKARIDYEEFLKLHEDYSRNHYIPAEDVFRGASLKREILGFAGYTHVRGREGRRVPLADASDERIGNVYRNAYRQALRNRLRK